jgi:integrase
MVRQHYQRQHQARLRKRDQGLHALHRYQPAGRIPHRDPGACNRLARRSRQPRARRRHDPASPRGAVVAVRISLRQERRHPQSGQRREAATVRGGEGKTPAIGDNQARDLLAAPAEDSIKDKRDRAILSTLLYHALRREELCKLKVKDFRHARRGVPHLKVSGKGDKTRYLPLHPGTNALIHDYLEAAGHAQDDNGALFRPLKNNRTGTLAKPVSPDAVYKLVKRYSGLLGFEIGAMRCGRRPPPMRLTIRPTSPRSRSGSATPILPPPASTITARPGRRTARPSRWPID